MIIRQNSSDFALMMSFDLVETGLNEIFGFEGRFESHFRNGRDFKTYSEGFGDGFICQRNLFSYLRTLAKILSEFLMVDFL